MKDDINRYIYVDKPKGTGKRNYYEQIVIPNWNYIRSLLVEGKTEEQTAGAIGIAYSTWNKYKASEPEFRQHINTSRVKLVSDLESKLFERALGISDETTITTKRVYNKFTKQWTDIEEVITKHQNKTNNTALIASLKYLSEEWRKALTNQPGDDNEDTSNIIDSIGTLIDKIKENSTDDE